MGLWIDRFGTGSLLMAGAAFAGLLFGAAVQRSGLCTRAALLECWQREWGARTGVWLVALAVACLGVQALVAAGWLQPAQSRLVGAPASLSGVIVGGALFGMGMVFTRGCPARLLVLAGSGNLRALVSVLVFGVVVQATLTGALSAPRQWVADAWRIDPGPLRDLGRLTATGTGWGWALGLGLLVLAVWLLRREPARLQRGAVAAAALAGAMVAAGWGWTAWVASASFDPVAVQSLNYSAPAAEWLIRAQLQAEFHPPWGFDAGLLPATVLGALLAAVAARQWAWQGYGPEHRVGANLLGAVLMGFGAVLAGGCTVGHGLSGMALGATSSLIALLAMAAGVGVGRAVARARGWPL